MSRHSQGNVFLSKVMGIKTLPKLLIFALCMVLIPQAFVMAAGLVFDKWLHIYAATPYIGATWIVLAVLCLVMIILAILGYIKNRKS